MDQVEIEQGHTLDNDEVTSSITIESTEGLMKGKYSFKTNSILRLGVNRVRSVVLVSEGDCDGVGGKMEFGDESLSEKALEVSDRNFDCGE